jgi:hypothetical protein
MTKRNLVAVLFILSLCFISSHGFCTILRGMTFKACRHPHPVSVKLRTLRPSVPRQALFDLKMTDIQQPAETVLPGMKRVLFIEMGFGADQHGQVNVSCLYSCPRGVH